MRENREQFEYMEDGNIIQPDGTRWPDEAAEIEVTVTPGQKFKIRTPWFEFKARLLLDPRR